MAMEKTVETRSEIQRVLDRFTRGEIDFQALLAALDQTFAADPAARRVALDLVDRQQPNGALQRSFFRVLKERIEQQLGDSAPAPRAGGRATAERNRAAPASSGGARFDATRPFGTRAGSRAERGRADATRPLDLSPPPGDDQVLPYETTLPFTPRAPRSEHGSPDATRPFTPAEPPSIEISPAEATRAFRSSSAGDEITPPESTPPLQDAHASTESPPNDVTPSPEATQASAPARGEPSPARDEPSPPDAKAPEPPLAESREERFVARRRTSSFSRGRYANRGWAATSRP